MTVTAMACRSVQTNMKCSALQVKAVDFGKTSQVDLGLGCRLGGLQQCRRFKPKRGPTIMQVGKSTAAIAGLSLPFGKQGQESSAPKEPATTSHVVQRGQVMSTIARLYNTDLRTLNELNPGVALDYVRPKQVLTVPDPNAAAVPPKMCLPKGKPVQEKQGGLLSLPFTPSNKAPEQQPPQTKETEQSLASVQTTEMGVSAAPNGPVEYRVQPGDSLYIIAEKHGVSMTEIVELNKMHFKTPIRPKEVLLIPATSNLQAVTVASVCPAPPPVCAAPAQKATSGLTLGLGITLAAATVFSVYQFIKKATSGDQVSADVPQPLSTTPQATLVAPTAAIFSAPADLPQLQHPASPPLSGSAAAVQPIPPPQAPLASPKPAAADLLEAATPSMPTTKQENALAQELLASPSPIVSSLEAPAHSEAAVESSPKQSETNGAANSLTVEPSVSNPATVQPTAEEVPPAGTESVPTETALPTVSETPSQAATLPPAPETSATSPSQVVTEDLAAPPVPQASTQEAAVAPVPAEDSGAPSVPRVTEGEPNAPSVQPVAAEASEVAPQTTTEAPAHKDEAASSLSQVTTESNGAAIAEMEPQSSTEGVTSEEAGSPLVPEVLAAKPFAPPEDATTLLVPQVTADVSTPAGPEEAAEARSASITKGPPTPSLIDILPDGLMPLENAQVSASQPQQTRDGQLGVGSGFRQDSTILLALRGAYQMASASLGPKHQTLAFVALSSGRIGLASQDFTWGSTAEAVLALRTTLPSDCNLQGICTWGVNGADGNGASKEEKSGVEWAAVLLFSAQGMAVSSGSTITTGSARLAAEMAAEGLREKAIGKRLKAVVIISSPQADGSAVEVVRKVIPGLPVYAISESRMPDRPERPVSFGKEWQVAPSGAAGAVAPGISLVGISTEAEFGGAFFATVVGQWLYGPKCTIEALPPASSKEAATIVGLVTSN